MGPPLEVLAWPQHSRPDRRGFFGPRRRGPTGSGTVAGRGCPPRHSARSLPPEPRRAEPRACPLERGRHSRPPPSRLRLQQRARRNPSRLRSAARARADAHELERTGRGVAAGPPHLQASGSSSSQGRYRAFVAEPGGPRGSSVLFCTCSFYSVIIEDVLLFSLPSPTIPVLTS